MTQEKQLAQQIQIFPDSLRDPKWGSIGELMLNHATPSTNCVAMLKEKLRFHERYRTFDGIPKKTIRRAPVIFFCLYLHALQTPFGIL